MVHQIAEVRLVIGLKVPRLYDLIASRIRNIQREAFSSFRWCRRRHGCLVKDLEITEPFQAVSSDISYIRTMEGFEYLCTVKDIASGIVLAETMAEHMSSELVLVTIKKALNRWHLLAGTIFHSDRGSQYTSKKVMEYLSENQIRQSFSRVGKPGDNAWSESFFANLKKEAVHWRHFKTREEARQAIFAYIEGFYNTRRIQKRLYYLSPIQWLRRWENGHLSKVA
ncbi:MAG: IS3 family transposase [Syntrophaceticus schinkii]